MPEDQPSSKTMKDDSGKRVSKKTVRLIDALIVFCTNNEISLPVVFCFTAL